MPANETSTKPSSPDSKTAGPLGPIIPILRSFNEKEMRAFYLDYLGFKLDWQHRFDASAPLYCQVSRDTAILHISEHHGDCTPGSAVRVWVHDLDEFHRELKGRPHPRLNPGIQDQPWGTREVMLTDPFSNRVVFVQVETPGVGA